MAGPWEKYQKADKKPWEKYGGPATPVAEDGGGFLDTAGDYARAAGAGLSRGVAAIPDTAAAGLDLIGEGLEGGANRLYKFVTGQEPPEEFRQASDAVTEMTFGRFGGGDRARTALSDATGGASDYRGDTRGQRVVSTAAEFVPGAVMFGGPRAAMQYGVAPGAVSEVAGQVAEGRNVPERVPMIGGQDAEPWARLGGALAGPAIYGAGRRAVQSMVTPNPADPARTAAAKNLADEGVTTTAGQRTGAENLRYREAMQPRTQGIVQGQGKQFTRAALRRIGEDADEATPAVMKRAADRIGGMFEDLAKRNDISPDPKLASDAGKAMQNYTMLTAKRNSAPLIKSIVGKIDDAVQSGKKITGRQYQEWRSQLGKALDDGDGAMRSAAKELRRALDDAMGRSLAQAGRADDLRAYATARQQWRDYLAIEDSVARAGEETAYGIINPRQLRSAIDRQGRSAYVQGDRELGELARSGNAVLAPLPQSGTQPRMAANTIQAMQGSGTGTAGGLATYALTSDPTLSIAAGVASAAAPYARNAASASRAGQAYLGNQLLPNRAPMVGGEYAWPVLQGLLAE